MISDVAVGSPKFIKIGRKERDSTETRALKKKNDGSE
jgi:hypothetical protein